MFSRQPKVRTSTGRRNVIWLAQLATPARLESNSNSPLSGSSIPDASNSIGPVIRIRFWCVHSTCSSPPGRTIVARRLESPFLAAQTSAAQAAEPQALVNPAPLSQVRTSIRSGEVTRATEICSPDPERSGDFQAAAQNGRDRSFQHRPQPKRPHADCRH